MPADPIHDKPLYPSHHPTGIPALHYTPLVDIPQWLIPYRHRVRPGQSVAGGAVHFFLFDAFFESVWNRPQQILRYLDGFQAVLTPDFSLNAGMPLAVQIWNTYRTRWCGAHWQAQGYTVIPTVAWSTPASYGRSVIIVAPYYQPGAGTPGATRVAYVNLATLTPSLTPTATRTPTATATPTLTPSPTLTSTATPTPDCSVGFQRQAFDQNGDPLPLNGDGCLPTPDLDCSDSVITLLYPSADPLPQELVDMRLASSFGLTVLNAPTLNAKPVMNGTLRYNWGESIRVYQRLTFPQTVGEQIWYQVSRSDDFPAPVGWIVVSYRGQSLTAGTDPCSAKPVPTTLTFPYDRQAAANYAIEQAWQHNLRHGSSSHGDYRVTWRLTNNVSGFPIPFANFTYSNVTGEFNATGSAVFVSEGIWMGGMPMTKGLGDATCDPNKYQDAGWCWETTASTNGNPSRPWGLHGMRVVYYMNVFGPPGAPNGNYTDVVLGQNTTANYGTPLVFDTSDGQPLGAGYLAGDRTGPDHLTSDDDLGVTDFNNSIPSLRMGDISSTLNLELLVSSELSSLRRGDFIVTNPFNGGGHGFLVVGWRAMEACSTAMSASTRYTIGDFTEARSASLTVPYVVDFTHSQSSTARPFYCSMYWDQTTPVTGYFGRHDWYFYKLKDNVTINTNQLYVDTNWTWDTTAGQ